MNPKFALVQIGKSTNVFIDGKYITNGIEALKRNSMEQRRVDVSWNSVETEGHRGDRR